MTTSVSDTTTGHEYGWQWLDTSEPTPLRPSSGSRTQHDADEFAWLTDTEPALPSSGHESTPRGHRRMWAALGVALTTAAIITGAGTLYVTGQHDTQVAAPAFPAPSSTITANPHGAACEGLTGETVTTGTAAPGTIAGAITAFEAAYYRQRDAAAALRWVAPEAGISPEALAAGIASIPAGTRHCVAVTPLANGVAEVHLAEARLGGQRIDYLQLINLRDTADGPIITNIQNRSRP
ncbi:hypothetical protein [Nocardia rhamnosiphila]